MDFTSSHFLRNMVTIILVNKLNHFLIAFQKLENSKQVSPDENIFPISETLG